MTQPHPTCNTTKMGSFGSSSESQPQAQAQAQPQPQPQPQPHQLFTVGAEVEVSSDEEGFKGSWYIATVLESSISKKQKKARVEYKTLLTEDGSEQLKEDVDLSYVRPLPPKDDVANAKDFVEGEIVGAYCRDGWWTGVVKKALGKSRYRVFFENPPDVIEFEVKDLRVHLEWLDGKWVRPTKQKKAESIFRSGTDVEVNIKKENLRDAWFPAIVIKENEDDTFIVKCQSSRNGDEAGLEKITVDLLHIRPHPPHPPVNKRYDVLEKVDAFWDFAWRPGVIVKLFTDTRYLVFFKLANENKIINQSEIRPHVEWKDGKWDRGSEEVLPASDVQERSGHAQNNTGNLVITTQIESSGVAKDKIETRTPLSTNSVKNLMEQHPNEGKEVTPASTPSMKTIKFRVPAPNGDATRTHPSKKLKTENAAEAPLSITASQSRKTPSKVSMKVLSGMATPNSGGKGSKLSGVIGNQPSAKTEGLVRQRKAWTKQRELGKLDNQRTNPVNTKRRYTKTPVKDPLTSASAQSERERERLVCLLRERETATVPRRRRAYCHAQSRETTPVPVMQLRVGKKGNASGGTAKESDQGTAKESDQAGVKKEAGIPFILGLEAKEMGGLVSGNPQQLSKKKNTNHSTKDKGIMEIEQQKSGGSSNKRKRGRPRKLVITSSEASLGGEEQNGVGGAANETDVKDHLTQEVASDMVTGEQSTDSHDTSRRKLAEVSGTNCTSNDAVMTKVDNTDDDDRPLSAWFGMQSPPNVNEPRPFSAGTADERIEEREGPVGGTADKLSEARGQVDTAQQVPATVDTEQQVPATVDTEQQVPATDTTGDSALDENRSLPFVKSSPLWKTIESMEIFKALPQNPHFRPLVRCTEAYREGLAIGNMVTFSSLVEKISKLQFGDPRSIFDSYLEGLRDLEKQGFDVTLLRSRINEMISFKDREAQILNESKDAEGKILHFDREKAEMAEEMANISKKIIELQEKRASIESEMENKKREIASLQMHADAIKEDIQSNRINFEKLAAAPWKSG